MERKQFLGATALAAAAVAVTGATTVSDSSNGGNSSAVNCGPPPRPRPSGSPGAHPFKEHHGEIESAYRHVERVVEMLSRDTNDYGGHKTPAIGFLQQAASELEQAVAYEQAHPSATSAPI